MIEQTSASRQGPADNPEFNQVLINQIAREFLAEQRRNRRWGIFFKLLFSCFVFLFLLGYLTEDMGVNPVTSGKHTALVDISGEIAADSMANADNVVGGLRAAYRNKNTVGIILRINSPGGSPVQSGYINDEIRRLRKEHPDIPVYAVISDICASGAYYIAAAADQIYADKASLVGSIGVIMSGFGFVDAIDKLGIERRLRHAGEYKAFLDSFSPQSEDDLQHVDMLLDSIYRQFISAVQEGRGERLADDDIIYSGLVWTGEQSVGLGLVDGLGSASYVAREIIGQENLVDYTYRPNYLQRLSEGLGSTLANHMKSMLNYQFK